MLRNNEPIDHLNRIASRASLEWHDGTQSKRGIGDYKKLLQDTALEYLSELENSKTDTPLNADESAELWKKLGFAAEAR